MRLLFATLLLAVLPPTATLAQQAPPPPPEPRAFDWLMEHRAQVFEHLREGGDDQAAEVLRKLGEAWEQRDGATASELADFFVEALCHHAAALIRWLREDAERFRRWLERMPTKMLTDYRGDGYANKAALKERLIDCIDRALEDETDKGVLDGLISVRQRFVETGVRVID